MVFLRQSKKNYDVFSPPQIRAKKKCATPPQKSNGPSLKDLYPGTPDLFFSGANAHALSSRRSRWRDDMLGSSLDIGLLVLFTFFNIQRPSSAPPPNHLLPVFSCEKVLNIKKYINKTRRPRSRLARKEWQCCFQMYKHFRREYWVNE
jgi:hypothetical protein